MSSLFCRHNKFTADCSICSKGTVLDPSRSGERTRAKGSGGSRSGSSRGSRGGGGRGAAAGGTRTFSGPHVKAGPYDRDEGEAYDVRLEKVPGGVRLAQWSRGSLERRAPELPAADLTGLVVAALEKELLEGRDAERLRAVLGSAPADGSAAPDGSTPAAPAAGSAPQYGVSPGRAGDMREELRVERLADGRVRVGRWLFWPGRGWELQEAPPMFPAARYAEALASAALGENLPN